MNILIYGAGPMGIALSLFCTLAGAQVTQIDCVPARLAAAKSAGRAVRTINFAEDNVDDVLSDCRFDLAIDCVGHTQILYEASRRVRPGGHVGSMGVLKQGDLLVDTTKLQVNTLLHMLNWPVGEYAVMDETIALIEEGKVNPKDFYSHVLPFTEIREAVSLVEKKEALNVILTMD